MIPCTRGQRLGLGGKGGQKYKKEGVSAVPKNIITEGIKNQISWFSKFLNCLIKRRVAFFNNKHPAEGDVLLFIVIHHSWKSPKTASEF